MEKNIVGVVSSTIRGFRLPRYHELPDTGLYLEQTTRYVNQCIRQLGFEDVTGSMIRNYVKHGIIANPIEKQYYANQIAHLIALALLKQVAHLEYVNNLFRMLDVHEHYTDQAAYDFLCDELENNLFCRFGLREASDEAKRPFSMEKEMLRSAVIAVSNIVYLNRCFKVILGQDAEAQPEKE